VSRWNVAMRKQGVFEGRKNENSRPTPPMLIKAILVAQTHATLFIRGRKIQGESTCLSIYLKVNLRLRLGILLGPFSGSLDGSVLILFPSLGDVVGERVIGIGCTEQSLNGKQDGADL
jgi:hypothetical protein